MLACLLRAVTHFGVDVMEYFLSGKSYLLCVDQVVRKWVLVQFETTGSGVWPVVRYLLFVCLFLMI